MSPYRFSMERVLQWREDLEKDFSEKLSQKKHEVKIKNFELEQLLEEYESTKKGSRAFKNVQDLVQTQNYKQILAEQIEKERGFISKLEDELESTRKELVEARKAKMAIEKIKEKDFIKYKEEQSRQEQEFLDEIATTRHTRKDDR